MVVSLKKTSVTSGTGNVVPGGPFVAGTNTYRAHADLSYFPSSEVYDFLQ